LNNVVILSLGDEWDKVIEKDKQPMKTMFAYNPEVFMCCVFLFCLCGIFFLKKKKKKLDPNI
jgi:hypothetical protein